MTMDAIDAILDHILLAPEEPACRMPADLDVAVDMLLDASRSSRPGQDRGLPPSASPCPASAA